MRDGRLVCLREVSERFALCAGVPFVRQYPSAARRKANAAVCRCAGGGRGAQSGGVGVNSFEFPVSIRVIKTTLLHNKASAYDVQQVN